ncbi:sensor domain-containing diguanylate cyclase [Paenibacillus hexagrammi]|uniref:GGDEF domain-containing protein n=1 Tax=Paenibacillus hexagrammi TaxID=2908839 RepID=A0ABY3SIV1_9BACL|nr:diguanylate cyclase [Paenibacillus sp. YPD9-1]UJF33418.1 GGDEF domain-containing protein [Paenibacillus sp. YPD9-1]
MDVRGKESESVPLEGEWAFYWNQLLTPDQVDSQAADRQYVEVPSSWNKYELAGAVNSYYGYATYALTLTQTPRKDKNALYIPNISTAYKIWVNGELLKQNGVIATSKEQAVPMSREFILEVPSDTETLHIVIQVSNFTHPRGGINESIKYGDFNQLSDSLQNKTAYDMFLTGALFIMCLYHLGLYCMRRSDSSPLYFSIFCLSIAVRTLLAGRTAVFTLLPQLTYDLAVRGEYIGLVLSVVSFTLFLRRIYTREMSLLVLRVLCLVSAVYAVIILSTELQFFMSLLKYFQIVILISISYALYVFILAAIRKREGALFSLGGSIVLTITIFNDILYNQGLILTGYYVPLGLLVFIVSHSFILGMSFSKAFASSEELASKLLLVNSSLEEKVRERTVELEEANRWLEKQTLADGLTGIANRRHFDEESQRLLRKAKNDNTGFCLLLMDIDCFKGYNDTYGHLAGDECLRKVARALDTMARQEGGMAARFGGEEFAYIACGASDELSGLAEQAVSGIRALTIPHAASGAAAHVTISCGMVTWMAHTDHEPPGLQLLIQKADELLYQAKQSGRDRYYQETVQ